jgi:hypothetical protein
MMTQTRADDPPPPELIRVLSQLENLSDDSFMQVSRWARAGADTVYNPIFDYEKLEVQINILDHDIRYAVLQWLRGSGRHDLYNLRVTDAQIGPRRQGADDPPPSTPTPDVWRGLNYASATLAAAGPDTGAIAVSKRVGAARIDGTAIAFCIAFTNNSPKTATLVHYEMALTDAGGHALGSVPFELHGTFSTGILIDTGVSSYRDMDLNGYNCNGVKTDQATLPVLGARYYTPYLTLVTYDDGTSWTGPTPAPTETP